MADIQVLQSVARLLESTEATQFFPLGLSETEASLLRLIAAERRDPTSPMTISKLGTKELVGGQSGARVYLLTDGTTQPFVAKIDECDLLTKELERYRQWIQDWVPAVISPTYHSHLGAAAISYRLQPDPDSHAQPAPTLERCLDQICLSEWCDDINTCRQRASDIYVALEAHGYALSRLEF